ncbi:TetR/AcrR family transcriptional regulator [Sporolactobacillus sp. CQH2019]|uniref:TetR/AcrR family transcriptional regulator n=1 Tax=Sporolactobacillus sp. CQH2019 TaxID=3023512 RepID=UPI002367EF0F|nr:TetR/AcrR family transcriptional regulator [Sporolactobacillus sp. CQH2019]MDD9150186.1 TetR/AcrR family transcriptional regulator [Sporolactobacillus sp. CQH2019]
MGASLIETNTKMLETEIKIQKAFIKLVHENGFDKLSVQQLSKAAGISRGTFYLHYVDKYDLLAHYEDDIVANISGIFRRYPKPASDAKAGEVNQNNNAFYQLFRYLYRQRDMAALLLNEHAAAIAGKVKHLIGEVLMQPDPSFHGKTIKFSANFAKEIVIQGIIDIIIYWLNQKTVLPPEEAYQIFLQSRSLSPQQLIAVIARS